jgi:excisionase family DNA binding protein
MSNEGLDRGTPAVGTTATERHASSGNDLHELLTVDEVAALLKVSRGWMYEHTRCLSTPRSERLPHLKIGKYVRFEARAVRAFLERKCRTM